MPAPSIVVTRRLPAPIEETLRRDYGAVLNQDDHQFGADEFVGALRSFDIVLCTLTDRLTRDILLTPGRRARLLANFGVGVNHIDLAAAADADLLVSNTPGVLTEDTADLTMLLVLAAARRAWEGDRELRSGQWTGWRPTHLLGTRVSGKTLGIVGLGRIGEAVARRATLGFRMPVQYWSRTRRVDAEAALGLTWCPDLEVLLATSDFVTLHCPATPETRHLINARRLGLMKPGAFLINTSRGDVVDEGALITALESGLLAGAALDVFDGEPNVSRDLLQLGSVTTLPHLGSATLESRVAMGECVLRNIAAFVAGNPLPNLVQRA